MLKICYFFSADWPEARDLLHEHAPDAEEIWTGDSVYDYWHAMAMRWGQDDLVTIEQDIGIHGNVIPTFKGCPEPWCSFGYQVGSYICTEGNGCRKISLEAQRVVTFEDLQYPVLHPGDPRNGVQDIGGCPDCAALCWRHLDTRIAGALRRAGYTVHVHTPNVRHLRMPKIDGGLCLRHGDQEARAAHRLACGNGQRGQVQVRAGSAD